MEGIHSHEICKGGPGNLNVISKLLPGIEVGRVIELLDDNFCSGASLAGDTSCMDKLTEMLKYHVMGEGEGTLRRLKWDKKLVRKYLLLVNTLAVDVGFVPHLSIK
ncbi:hypothetical protein PM10SUCC1_29020 [Propionigenium maris DSM 9537]|uniref:Uncharacterized protein n=1 Tax=Propionigenium maris DSM 9537 TaxID=1123000 RepID=A0A9W6GMU2_9FUSO|nr:TSCPD domain-containing protein [Propionigenium maris]GLI57388.1 hypothetical protein PM10SUCC1_29020 [Propionigenium maris DSM 9537]